MVILRVCLHALLLMILLNLLTLAFRGKDVPVLEQVLNWINWQAFSLFSFACASELNKQRAFLIIIAGFIALCYVHLSFQENMPILISLALGLLAGYGLERVFGENLLSVAIVDKK